MKRISLVPLAVALAILAVGLSCSKQPAEVTEPPAQPPGAETAGGETTFTGEPVQVGILTNAIAPFWDSMKVGMERAAADPTVMPTLGGGIALSPVVEEVFTKLTDALIEKQSDGGLPPCEASWKGPQGNTLPEQRRLLEEFEAAGVDGISISPIESAPLVPVLDALVDGGTIVLCMDSDASASKRLAYVGTNNYEAGKVAGEAAAEVFGEAGAKMIGFVGDRAAENAKERIDGFTEVAAQHGIELVEVREDGTDPSKARRNAEDAIQAFPDVTGFLGIWSYDAAAITQAVLAADAQDRIKVVSFDAEPQTLLHLQKGEIEATVVQKPYLFGYLSVQLIYAAKVLGIEAVQEMLPDDGVIDTGVTVVTPENIEPFMEYLDELGVESS